MLLLGYLTGDLVKNYGEYLRIVTMWDEEAGYVFTVTSYLII